MNRRRCPRCSTVNASVARNTEPARTLPFVQRTRPGSIVSASVRS